MAEPRYVSADPFEEELNPKVRPKWMKLTHDNERLIMNAVGRKYYKSQEERREVRNITKTMMSLKTGITVEYPSEWVRECCLIAERMRNNRQMIQLKGLLTLINNTERKKEFLEHWQETPRESRKGRMKMIGEEDETGNDGS